MMTKKGALGFFVAAGLFVAGMELAPHKKWVSTAESEDEMYFGAPSPHHDVAKKDTTLVAPVLKI